MLMNITPTPDGLRIEGELDTSTAPQLREAMGKALEGANGGGLVLDVSRLSFMDSSGLHVLMEAVASRNGAALPIVLQRPTRPVKRMLEIALPGGVHGLEMQG